MKGAERDTGAFSHNPPIVHESECQCPASILTFFRNNY